MLNPNAPKRIIADDSQTPDRIWTAQERFDAETWTPQWVRFEHEQRYRFASGYVTGKTVVDCGCGMGLGTRQFANSGAKEVIGIDRSLPDAELRGRIGASGKVSFLQGDATAMPLPNCVADVFISLETIEHLDHPTEFLAEVCRVLRRDGVLVISTPNRTVTNPGKTLRDKPWNQHHVREYSTSEFVELLGPFFSQVDLYGQNRANVRVVALLAWLGNRSSGHIAVRIRQLLKLPWLLFDSQARHEVQRNGGRDLHEYLVAVCQSPRSIESIREPIDLGRAPRIGIV